MKRAAPTSVQSVVFEKDMAVSGKSVLIIAPGSETICRRWRIRVSVKRRGPACAGPRLNRDADYFLVEPVLLDGVLLDVVPVALLLFMPPLLLFVPLLLPLVPPVLLLAEEE